MLDEAGRCVDVVKRERGEAEQMIEEFMLLANSSAAALARRLKLRRSCPFARSAGPREDRKKAEADADGGGCGLPFCGRYAHHAGACEAVSRYRGTNLERSVHTSVLRSMAKAKYEPQPKGHFGLALADYAHFTSPIRRYPDLAIHRILSDVCAGMDDGAVQKNMRSSRPKHRCSPPSARCWP